MERAITNDFECNDASAVDADDLASALADDAQRSEELLGVVAAVATPGSRRRAEGNPCGRHPDSVRSRARAARGIGWKSPPDQSEHVTGVDLERGDALGDVAQRQHIGSAMLVTKPENLLAGVG